VEEVETADAVTDFGFAGCAHAKKSSVRQLLLLDQETLDAMGLRPGRDRENITTEGIGVSRRGMLCQVLQGGTIRAGDAIARVAAASS
jgi:MOSC domain-containing protein YiiM